MNKIILAVLALSAIFAAGCGSDAVVSDYKPPTKEALEANMKRIEADPNMPPAAKEAAINAIKMQLGDGGEDGRASAAMAEARKAAQQKK